MRFIDTHTHLYEPQFDEDLAETMARAAEQGVETMMFPAIDSQSHERMFKVCREYSNCLPMMGVHPTSINGENSAAELEIVERYLATPPVERFYGIGEVGLDLYWSQEWRKEQIEVFERQIELSLQYDLPLVIHTRDAWSDMVEVLERYKGRGVRGVMHAFADSVESFRRIDSCGEFVFGIGGVVTYKKSTLPEVVAEIPLEKIVVETDSPYLPPVPFRGKRNESSYVTYTCAKVAEIKGVSLAEAAEQTTKNAERIFRL